MSENYKRGKTKFNHAEHGECFYYITDPNGLILVCMDKSFGISSTYHLCEPETLSEALKPRQTSIKKVSDNKKDYDKVYATLRKVYLTGHALCEAKILGCLKVANQIHHKAGRVGKNYIEIHTFMAVCPNCHHWIENNVTKAKELGFSTDRL